MGGVDKAKVRVFFAEVEGNNDSVQEALKTMVSAMSRPVRLVSEHKPNGSAVGLLEHPAVEDVEEVIGQMEDSEVAGLEPATSNARRPRGSGKKTDRNAGIRLVPDLNFRPDGKQALRDFVEQKAPESDVETVLAGVYYMQHMMELPKIGPSHVMTAYKELGKPIPADLKQTIRNLMNRDMRVKFDDIEDIRTTTQGENFVEHEMGKANSV